MSYYSFKHKQRVSFFSDPLNLYHKAFRSQSFVSYFHKQPSTVRNSRTIGNWEETCIRLVFSQFLLCTRKYEISFWDYRDSALGDSMRKAYWKSSPPRPQSLAFGFFSLAKWRDIRSLSVCTAFCETFIVGRITGKRKNCKDLCRSYLLVDCP